MTEDRIEKTIRRVPIYSSMLVNGRVVEVQEVRSKTTGSVLPTHRGYRAMRTTNTVEARDYRIDVEILWTQSKARANAFVEAFSNSDEFAI